MSYDTVYTFSVWCPEQGESKLDAVRVRAISSQRSAESWLKNKAFYDTTGGGLLAHVRAPDNTERHWRVTAKMTTIYTAIEEV